MTAIGRALQGRHITALGARSNAPRGFHRVESARAGDRCSLHLTTRFTPTDAHGAPIDAARADRLALRLDRLTFIYGEDASGLIDLMFGEGDDELLLDFRGREADHARALALIDAGARGCNAPLRPMPTIRTVNPSPGN